MCDIAIRRGGQELIRRSFRRSFRTEIAGCFRGGVSGSFRTDFVGDFHKWVLEGRLRVVVKRVLKRRWMTFFQWVLQRCFQRVLKYVFFKGGIGGVLKGVFEGGFERWFWRECWSGLEEVLKGLWQGFQWSGSRNGWRWKGVCRRFCMWFWRGVKGLEDMLEEGFWKTIQLHFEGVLNAVVQRRLKERLTWIFKRVLRGDARDIYN